MDVLTDLSWRIYPSSVLMTFGGLLALLGVQLELSGFRLPTRNPSHILKLVRGLRLFILGLALAGLGASWAWNLLWLFILSLVIGGEEMMEISIVIHMLRKRQRQVEQEIPNDG